MDVETAAGGSVGATPRRAPLITGAVAHYDWDVLKRSAEGRDYISARRPAVLAGAFEEWPARKTWSLQYLKERYGSFALAIDGQSVAMGEFIGRVLASTPEAPAPYLRNFSLANWPAELREGILPTPECTQPNWLASRWFPARQRMTDIELFIGGAGARFPVLHYDYWHAHAFLMQIEGVKEYLVFAPDQTPFLYEGPGGLKNKSLIDNIEAPDLARFPLCVEATGTRVELHPGEMLYIPAGWWHTVRILTPSITVSCDGANAANWALFKSDYLEAYRGKFGLKGALYATYFAAFERLMQFS